MKLRYQLWDVFTTEPLSGNPLAVVLGAETLSDSLMQRVARFNLSETSFVLPSARADLRARFFTPARELPTAGHPSLGTVYALAAARFVSHRGVELGRRSELRVEVRRGAGARVGGSAVKVGAGTLLSDG